MHHYFKRIYVCGENLSVSHVMFGLRLLTLNMQPDKVEGPLRKPRGNTTHCLTHTPVFVFVPRRQGEAKAQKITSSSFFLRGNIPPQFTSSRYIRLATTISVSRKHRCDPRRTVCHSHMHAQYFRVSVW